MDILTKKPSELNRSQFTLRQSIQEFENATGFKFTRDVKPGIVKYAQTQLYVAEDTINGEEISIRETDKKIRDKFYRESRPNFGDFGKAALSGAVLEGGVTFLLCVIKKQKNGSEWSDVIIETTLGVIKGAIRGAGVYAFTSFTPAPASVATALFTAIFGIAGQTRAFVKGKIDADEFAANANQICLDVSVSVGFSALGQTLIPVPVLGALIGNATGIFLYGLIKNYAFDLEELNIKHRRQLMNALDRELEQTLNLYALILQSQFAYFSRFTEFSDSPEEMLKLAEYANISREKLILNEDDAQRIFTL
jgi:hypothetical protein